MGRVKLLGIEVDPLTVDQLNEIIRTAVARGTRAVVANHNAHSAYLFHHDGKMRAFYERADWIHVDGMALVGAGRLLGRQLTRAHRVTYIDWIDSLMAQSSALGHRIFYLGSAPGVAERGADLLRRQYPELRIATHHGFFDADSPDENAPLLSAIRDYRPDILMVGMGMPRQEHWVLDHLESLEVPTILTAGACMDLVAGVLPTPPRWMGRWGLEWMYRLASNPSRV